MILITCRVEDEGAIVDAPAMLPSPCIIEMVENPRMGVKKLPGMAVIVATDRVRSAAIVEPNMI